MTNPIHNEIERSAAELEQTVEQLSALQDQLQTSSYSATDRNRCLTVTVNSMGELTEARFTSSAYRTMAPAELGQLIVDTTRDARGRAMKAVVASLSGVLPSGLPIEELLSGDVRVDEVVSASMAEFESSLPDFLRGTGNSQ